MYALTALLVTFATEEPTADCPQIKQKTMVSHALQVTTVQGQLTDHLSARSEGTRNIRVQRLKKPVWNAKTIITTMFPGKRDAKNADRHQRVSVEQPPASATVKTVISLKQVGSVCAPPATNLRITYRILTVMQTASWFPKKDAQQTRMSTHKATASTKTLQQIFAKSNVAESRESW